MAGEAGRADDRQRDAELADRHVHAVADAADDRLQVRGVGVDQEAGQLVGAAAADQIVGAQSGAGGGRRRPLTWVADEPVDRQQYGADREGVAERDDGQ